MFWFISVPYFAVAVSHNSAILYHHVCTTKLSCVWQVMDISIAGTEEEGVAVGPLGNLCLDVKDSQVRVLYTADHRRSLFCARCFCNGSPLSICFVLGFWANVLQYLYIVGAALLNVPYLYYVAR